NKRITLDVRVLSSTNRDLGAGIRAGTFREDLYYRLNVFQIHLPPLRERQQDISHLAAFFLARFCQELGKPAPALAPGTCQLLEQYSWPGNVRELQNLMERAAVLATGPEVEPGFFRLLLPQAAATAAEPAGETLALEPAVEEAPAGKGLAQSPGNEKAVRRTHDAAARPLLASRSLQEPRSRSCSAVGPRATRLAMRLSWLHVKVPLGPDRLRQQDRKHT